MTPANGGAMLRHEALPSRDQDEHEVAKGWWT